jgi:hypothetical protein
MAHVRKQIRDAIEALLVAGVPLVSGRVYGSRVYPLTDANIPALLVYTASEESGLQTMGRKTLMRDLSVSIDAYVRVTSNFDDDVDAICAQIEGAIGADFYLSGLSKNTVLASTEIDFDGEAEQPIGVARLTYDVRYVTDVDNAETAK